MALLVEGLGVSADTSIEEYIIGPVNEHLDEQDPTAEKDTIMLYGPEGLSWVAQPVTGQSLLGSALGLISRQGSIVNPSIPLMDPLVTLFGSVHERLPEMGSMRSTLFPNFGSMFSVAEHHHRTEESDEEQGLPEGDDYTSDGAGGDSDDNLHSPLLSRHGTGMGGKDTRHNSNLMQGNAGEAVSSMGIGGGWQLAWKWVEREAADGMKEGGFKRIYLHQEGVPASHRGSLVSIPGGIPEENEYVQAAALVSQPALYPEITSHHPAGPAMVHPSEVASKGPKWGDLCEAGVRHALFVGIGIQILQQVITNYGIKKEMIHFPNFSSKQYNIYLSLLSAF